MKVGVGQSEIRLNDLLPFQGFTHISLPLHTRVLFIQAQRQFALVAIELTSIPEEIIQHLKGVVESHLNLSEDQIWICTSHSFSAPHFRSNRAIRQDPALQEDNLHLLQAVELSLAISCLQAKDSLEECEMGFTYAQIIAGCNRNVLTEQGWWSGHSGNGFSSPDVPILIFKKPDSSVKAILFTLDVQSSITQGGRQISADYIGEVCNQLEERYSTVAIGVCGCAGDQVPMFQEPSSLPFASYLVEIQSRRIADEIEHAIGKTHHFYSFDSISLALEQVLVMGKKRFEGTELYPRLQVEWELTQEKTIDVWICVIGFACLIGVAPELNSHTGSYLRERSPYPVTLVMTMVNGARKYCPERLDYDRVTYEALSSDYASGSAELVTNAIEQFWKEERK